jgi:anti-sigma factor RsiW
MTCRELVTFLRAYLDGELPESVRRPFDEHLAGCAECAAYLRSYRDTVDLAKGAFPDLDAPVPAEVPEDLVSAVMRSRSNR